MSPKEIRKSFLLIQLSNKAFCSTCFHNLWIVFNRKSLPVMLYLTYPQPVFLASFQIYVKLTILHGLL